MDSRSTSTARATSGSTLAGPAAREPPRAARGRAPRASRGRTPPASRAAPDSAADPRSGTAFTATWKTGVAPASASRMPKTARSTEATRSGPRRDEPGEDEEPRDPSRGHGRKVRVVRDAGREGDARPVRDEPVGEELLQARRLERPERGRALAHAAAGAADAPHRRGGGRQQRHGREPCRESRGPCQRREGRASPRFRGPGGLWRRRQEERGRDGRRVEHELRSRREDDERRGRSGLRRGPRPTAPARRPGRTRRTTEGSRAPRASAGTERPTRLFPRARRRGPPSPPPAA